MLSDANPANCKPEGTGRTDNQHPFGANRDNDDEESHSEATNFLKSIIPSHKHNSESRLKEDPNGEAFPWLEGQAIALERISKPA